MKKYNAHILTTTSNGARKAINNKLGFSPFNFDIDGDELWFGPRNILETDSNFKHIIPYVIVEQDGKYLTYRRTSKGGESRLHGNFSLGFGGHIDICDCITSNNGSSIDLNKTIMNSAERELSEELGIFYHDGFEFFGLILDDSNAVGSVHLGVVLKIKVPSGLKIVSPEDQIDLQGFKNQEELLSDINDYENWSSYLINHLNTI